MTGKLAYALGSLSQAQAARRGCPCDHSLGLCLTLPLCAAEAKSCSSGILWHFALLSGSCPWRKLDMPFTSIPITPSPAEAFPWDSSLNSETTVGGWAGLESNGQMPLMANPPSATTYNAYTSGFLRGDGHWKFLVQLALWEKNVKAGASFTTRPHSHTKACTGSLGGTKSWGLRETENRHLLRDSVAW